MRCVLRQAACGWLSAVVALTTWTGCADSRHAPVVVAPQERMELQNRALELLLSAARSDLPDVSCNAIEALAKVAPRDGLPIFRQATQATSPLVRYAGFAALGDLRDRESLERFRAGAKDAHAHVQLAAAYAAARCGKDGYVRVLVNTLMTAPAENLRADAAGLLGRLGDKRAVRWLRSAGRQPNNDKSKPAKLAINAALAALGEDDAVQELVRASQGDAESRADALLLLADLGHPDGRDALRYRLAAEQEYLEARLIAARGLGKLGDAAGFELALANLNYRDPNDKVATDNPDPTYPVRSMAVHALAEIGDMRAIPPLRQLAAAEDDARLQVAACYALCKILNTSAARESVAGNGARPR